MHLFWCSKSATKLIIFSLNGEKRALNQHLWIVFFTFAGVIFTLSSQYTRIRVKE